MYIYIYYLMGEKAIWLDIMQPYFHEPQTSENTAQECILASRK